MIKTFKKRAKRSLIWKMSTSELITLVKNSDSLNKVLLKFGLTSKGGNTNTLKRRLIEENIDFSHIKLGMDSNRGRKFPECNRLSLEECKSVLFIENCSYDRSSVKRYLKIYNMFPYICKNCELEPIWDNNPLTLQLDHINGVGTDNRIENLRWLCPNCHSQTDTFAGKSNKITHLCMCGKEKCKSSLLCNDCYQKPENRVEQYNNSSTRKFMRKVIRPSKEILEKEIREFPMSILGKKYGVSDNSIRKWCKSYGIDNKNISKFSHTSRKKFKLEHPKQATRKFPSRYLYVSFNSGRNKWMAHIKDKDKKSLFCKRFNTELEAAEAVSKHLNSLTLILRNTPFL